MSYKQSCSKTIRVSTTLHTYTYVQRLMKQQSHRCSCGLTKVKKTTHTSTSVHFNDQNLLFEYKYIVYFNMHHFQPTIDLFLPLNRTSSSFLMTADDLLEDDA